MRINTYISPLFPASALLVAVHLLLPPAAASILNLGAEQIVQAGGVNLSVPGHSVPAFVDWNNDGLGDLIVGQGNGTYPPGKLRVYVNTGAPAAPQFSSYFFAQSNGADLTVPASGCLGLFGRTTYWDADGRKDLVVGKADGTVLLYTNIGTDAAPTFDGGINLQVGQLGSKVNINVGARATPIMVDWNNDGRKDLVIGGLDGKIHVFINEGTDTAPDFLTQILVQSGGTDLVVPTQRSSPVVLDLTDDGKKDLLTGNTEGQLLLYPNNGTDANPSFSSYSYVTADGVPIHLPGTPRSRPFVCDWNSDGLSDVLIGAGDGLVHLYLGVPEPTTLGLLGLAALVLRFRRAA